MDNSVYYVESAVYQAPIERRIGDINSSIFFLTPNSTGLFVSEKRSTRLSPSTAEGAVKIELRFDKDLSSANAHITGDKEDWSPSYIKTGVEPITASLTALARSQVSKIANLDAYAPESSDLSRVALRAVVDTVEEHIKSGDLSSLNELLRQVQPTALRKITAVAFLRTSFRVRDQLSNWAGLYDRTMIHLKETDQDADRALRGLSRKKVNQIV